MSDTLLDRLARRVGKETCIAPYRSWMTAKPAVERAARAALREMVEECAREVENTFAMAGTVPSVLVQVAVSRIRALAPKEEP